MNSPSFRNACSPPSPPNERSPKGKSARGVAPGAIAIPLCLAPSADAQVISARGKPRVNIARAAHGLLTLSRVFAAAGPRPQFTFSPFAAPLRARHSSAFATCPEDS